MGQDGRRGESKCGNDRLKRAAEEKRLTGKTGSRGGRMKIEKRENVRGKTENGKQRGNLAKRKETEATHTVSSIVMRGSGEGSK